MCLEVFHLLLNNPAKLGKGFCSLSAVLLRCIFDFLVNKNTVCTNLAKKSIVPSASTLLLEQSLLALLTSLSVTWQDTASRSTFLSSRVQTMSPSKRYRCLFLVFHNTPQMDISTVYLLQIIMELYTSSPAQTMLAIKVWKENITKLDLL